jgi:hypothetical protein
MKVWYEIVGLAAVTGPAGETDICILILEMDK